MKFISIFFPLLLASTANATSSINQEFDEQVEQVHQTQSQVQLRGAMSNRSQEWLDSSNLYLSDSLQWSHKLKQQATIYASEGAKGDTCTSPQITLSNSVNGLVVSYGMGTSMMTLPSTNDIFQSWEADARVDLGPLSSMKKVGCGDALNKASDGKMGCYVSVCLLSFN